MKTGLNSTSHASRIGLIIQQADGRIQSCNQQAENILGYSSAEMIGVVSPQESWQGIQAENLPFPPNTHPAFAFYHSRSVASALTTGQPC
ncbi:hypothetical protein C7B62_24120, partial [Pleurocapsa sp. CCALA 161]|uniref:PAS domain S-box protein n=1 Tax=Pleurocapsa sp. CCALA 161 TaxID=2107688 RepID=UPI000D4EB066